MNEQNPYPSPVPPKMPTELEQFVADFDQECMDALGRWQEDETEMPELKIDYNGKTISLPMHAQLFDDFMEFLVQQLNEERS